MGIKEDIKETLLFWRNENDSEEDKNSLREFIYLDDVSVTSLLASISRGVPTSLTEKNMTKKSKKGELSVEPYGVGVKGQNENITKSSTEVVRKFVAQSQFSELLRVGDYTNLTNGGKEKISVDELKRGGILEVEIELRAYFLFHLYKFSDYFFELYERIPQSQSESMQKTQELMKLVKTLFPEEIPVVGKVKSYKYVEDDNEVVCCENLSENQGSNFSVVGTLKPDMLWQNPNIFLYEENTFTAYCRISEGNIKEQWQPLKLTKALNSLFPKLGNQFSSQVNQIKEEFNSSSQENINRNDTPEVTNDALKDYLEELEEDQGLNLESNTKEEIIENVTSQNYPDNIQGTIRAFRKLTNLTREKVDTELDQDAIVSIREGFLKEENNTSNEFFNFEQGNKPEVNSKLSKELEQEQNSLEVNFIAIYW